MLRTKPFSFLLFASVLYQLQQSEKAFFYNSQLIYVLEVQVRHAAVVGSWTQSWVLYLGGHFYARQLYFCLSISRIYKSNNSFTQCHVIFLAIRGSTTNHAEIVWYHSFLLVENLYYLYNSMLVRTHGSFWDLV